MWDYDSLYNKSKDFVRKGLEHQDPISTEVPLWCILGLELLARATLSRKNPALLADPKEDISILSACGYPGNTAAKSLSASKVFQRCEAVCEGFLREDRLRCVEWLNWRNVELHTGSSPFNGLKKGAWQPQFFRICDILLGENETNLKEFVGRPHTAVAIRMIEGLNDEKKKEAHDRVKEQKAKFAAIDVQTRLERIGTGSTKAENVPEIFETPKGVRVARKVIQCPSCEGKAIIVAAPIRSSSPRDDRGKLVQENTWLPVILRCECCKLKLVGHAYVSALGLGEQFVTRDVVDPIDYYQIEFQSTEEDDG